LLAAGCACDIETFTTLPRAVRCTRMAAPSMPLPPSPYTGNMLTACDAAAGGSLSRAANA
jgi:hypothetical protein